MAGIEFSYTRPMADVEAVGSSNQPETEENNEGRTRNPAARCWILNVEDDAQKVELRELDLNQRPSGYEPDELPNCSIPR